MNREYYFKRLYNYLRLGGSTSQNTWKVYSCNLSLLLNKFSVPEQATLLQLQDFALEFKNDNYRKNICVIIRWLYNKVLNWDIKFYELPYPKKKQKVQSVYSHEEVLKILSVIKNEKHKAIVALIADCGLRISEPCSIFLTDCNSKERSIVIRDAKGDNDRVVYPSEYVWGLIKLYWHKWKFKPETYLFEGVIKNMPYTTESIRAIIKRACYASGVQYKQVHSFRRFTGTYLVEQKTPTSVVAKLFGHKSERTVEKHYTIHSPVYLRGINTPLQRINL